MLTFNAWLVAVPSNGYVRGLIKPIFCYSYSDIVVVPEKKGRERNLSAFSMAQVSMDNNNMAGRISTIMIFRWAAEDWYVSVCLGPRFFEIYTLNRKIDSLPRYSNRTKLHAVGSDRLDRLMLHKNEDETDARVYTWIPIISIW